MKPDRCIYYLWFILLGFILGMAFCSGCSSSQKKTDINWSPITSRLKGKLLHADSSLASGFRDVMMFHDTLIARQTGNYLMKACCITEDSIRNIGEFVIPGSGTYEMINPGFYWNNQKNILTIYDLTSGPNKIISLSTLPVSNIFDKTKWNISQFTDFIVNKEPVTPILATYMEGNKFIAAPVLNSGKLFALIDNNANRIEFLDFNYPEDGCQITAPDIRPIAYTGFLLKHPVENKFVYSPFANRYILIARYENGEMEEIASPYKSYPKYSLAKNGINILFDGKSYIGPTCIYPTCNYIYILMNNRTYDDIKADKLTNGYDFSYCNTIYVFDWKGAPVRKYLLDRQINSIWVDENDRHLYASTQDMDNKDQNTIYIRYNIPQMMVTGNTN